jgi:hypothetical protein
MKTKTYAVYSFDELSPEAQKRAIAAHREFLSREWSAETVIQDAKQAFAFASLEINKVFYSGFWSQGDGACFEGTWRARGVNAAGMREYAPIDAELNRIADGFAKIAAQFPEAEFVVKHSGHYYHENCTEFSFDLPETLSDSEFHRIEKNLTELAKDAMRWIYRQLEKEYEWATADEQVIESIRAKGYEFTEDGQID